MVDSRRDLFFRWYLLGFSVLEDNLWSDLGKSVASTLIFGGDRSDDSEVIMLSGRICWISRFESRSDNILKERYCRYVGDLRDLCRSQCYLQFSASQGLRKVSWQRMDLKSAGVTMVSSLDIEAVLIDGCGEICGIYHWKNDCTNLETFLSLCQVRGSLQSQLIKSSMLGKQTVEKTLGAVVSKLRIKIPSFDNSALIASYSKTVVGRCLNPLEQDMKTLLFMFPRIWQVEGRVIGTDLGMGKFQFDFEAEEDISEVLKMEPFHFDSWMVSMVKWEPTVDPAYPSSLKFWIHVIGVPLQFRAELTFSSIGDALGKVVAVDLKGRRVQVILDGLKPLVFDTTVEFGNGEETPISLWYEKLQRYCSHCFSLCHDVEFCEKKHGAIKPVPSRVFGNAHGEAQNMSYKAVVNQDKQLHPGYEGKGKGIASGKEKEEGRKLPPTFNNGTAKGNQRRFQQGEASSKHRRFTNYAQMNDHRYHQAQKKAAEASGSGVVQQNQAPKTKKLVRKSLAFEDEGTSLVAQQVISSANVEAAKVVDGMEMVTATGQTVQHSDLELGEITPASEGNLALNSEFVSQKGLEAKDLAVAMETEAVLEPEDENEALDRVLKEMEDAIAAGEIIPIEELPTSEGELGPLEVQVEKVDSEVKAINSDILSDAGTKEGDTTEVAFADLGEDMESAVDDDIGKGPGNEAQVTKRRLGKGLALSGVNSRKRNVQTFVSPRKRTAPKGGQVAGNNTHPTNQGKEKDGLGGSKPPNP